MGNTSLFELNFSCSSFGMLLNAIVSQEYKKPAVRITTAGLFGFIYSYTGQQFLSLNL